MGTRSKLGIVTLLLLTASVLVIMVAFGSTDGTAWHEAPETTPEEAGGAAAADPATSEEKPPDDPGQQERELAATEVAPSQQFERDAVYGVVQDEKGQAIAGAALELHAGATPGAVVAGAAPVRASSGGDGRFRFTSQQPFTRYELSCAADGRLPVKTQAYAGRDLRIVLPRAGWLTGQVLDADARTPIPGVSLSVSGPGMPWDGPLVVQSDARGGYRLATPVGQVTVWVRREGALPESRKTTVADGEPTTFDILLAVLTPRSGEVFDGETGAPVAGALIRDQTPRRTVLATSDASGRFTFGSTSGATSALFVQAPGYGTSQCDPRAQPAGPLRIALLKGGVIEGVVVDSAGHPLAGAAVRVVPQEPPEEPALRKPFDDRKVAAKALMPNLPPGTSLADWFGVLAVQTDAKGRFRLTGLVSTSGLALVTARASLAGYCDGSSSAVELPVIGGIASVHIRMSRGAVVAGVVLASDKPARAGVTAQAAERAWSTETNDAGEYRIADLPTGRVRMAATLTAYRFVRGNADVDLAEGGEARKDFALDGRVATIRGVVADASGAPASRVMVRARTEQQGSGMRNFNVTTADDGAFEIHVPGSPAGSVYAVTATRGPASVTKAGVVPAAEAVALTLPALGSVRLRVADEEDGSPVRQLALEWRSAGQPSWTGYSHSGRRFEPGADGCHEVLLPVGNVDLRISAQGGKYLREVVEGVPVLLQPLERRVALRRTAALELRFVGDAASLKTYRFLLEWRGADGQSTTRRFSVNASGRYSAQGLEPGTWRLRATPANIVLTPSEVTLPSGPVEIRWTVSEAAAGAAGAASGKQPGG